MNAPIVHPADDDLVLHYYDEGPAGAVEVHLGQCAACRQRFEALRHALASLTPETAVPAGAPAFGPAEVERAWRTLAPKLARERTRSRLRGVMLPLAMAAALVVAFTLGRRWPAPAEDPARGSERVLLVALGDHLERSEMLLVELVNAPAEGPLDIGPERLQAEELLGASRLYRAAATRAGEPGLAGVLEELERLLVEVAHRPSPISSDDLARLQRRIDARGLLFKVRVLGARVRTRQTDAIPGTAAVS
jgi:hypothetical protein